jgi:hypothetical protein
MMFSAKPKATGAGVKAAGRGRRAKGKKTWPGQTGVHSWKPSKHAKGKKR